MDDNDRKRKWFEVAISKELEAIQNLPVDLNIRKPSNPFWISMIKIASLCKGGASSSENLLIEIKRACKHMNLQGKEIDYQWKRAYQHARPRNINESPYQKG